MFRYLLVFSLLLQSLGAKAELVIELGYAGDPDWKPTNCAKIASEGEEAFNDLVKVFRYKSPQKTQPEPALPIEPVARPKQEPPKPKVVTPAPAPRPKPEPKPEPPVADTQRQTPRDPAADNYANYSNHPAVKKMLQMVKANSGSSQLACAKYVKMAMCHSSSRGPCTSSALLKGYPGAQEYVPAANAGGFLKANCFKNIMHSKAKPMTPAQAPIGAILVYDGGPYGHIEIKRTQTEYCSDYCGRVRTKNINSISGSGRRLIGVYVKPDLDPKNPDHNPKNCR